MTIPVMEYPRRCSRVLAVLVSMLLATLLVSSSALAQEQPEKAADKGPAGAPYEPGELLVAYDSDISDGSKSGIADGVGARVERNLPKVKSQLLKFPEVAAEPAQQKREDALEKIRQSLESRSGVESADFNYIRTTSFTPNDTYFNNQYGVMTPRFPKGWDYSRGRNVRVGVVDSGIDRGHPDLSGKIAATRNFTADDSVNDNDGHGTHVAGTAAAATNNDRGVAGSCPDCDLLIAKALSGGSGSDTDVAEGIMWTVDNGAEVVNLSLGGPGNSTTLERAVDYAWNQGVVVVAAAGNESTNQKSYPAAYENAIAVAATDQEDQPASFSNFGDWIDVAAPGVRILSTLPGGGYGYKSGTSMSTPHVAGLVGMLAGQGRNKVVIRARIEKLAEDLGASGKDPRYGSGRIDAARSAYRYRQVVDNAEPRFRSSDNWRTVTGSSQRFRKNYRLTKSAGINDSALFKHRIPSTGRYTVCAWWAASPLYNERATFAIKTADGFVRRAVDQRENGGKWNCMGRFELARGDEFYVRLLRRTPEDGYLIADAVLVLGV